jgi:predicted transcriptional regulator
MATEAMKLTTQIVSSLASMSELTPKELVQEIKDIYAFLTTLEAGEVAAAPCAPEEAKAAEVKRPAIPLDEIVKEKYVVCLECGKKMRTLKAHLRKAHKLAPADYFRRYGLEPQKFPLVCQEYSEQRGNLAKEKGLGERGFRRKKAS